MDPLHTRRWPDTLSRRMQKTILVLVLWFSIPGLSIISPLDQSMASEPSAKRQLLERVLGNYVDFDADTHEAVRNGPPGKRWQFDTDNDGKPDEVWFIDTSSRHKVTPELEEKFGPLLVRAIDEDGDLDWGNEPDLDSDLYIADWKADGTVNAFIDYIDNDFDNDVDEMGSVFYLPEHGEWGNQNSPEVLWLMWFHDVGDDNLLMHDTGYIYLQGACEYRTHFGGNEEFSVFQLSLEADHWLGDFENPFAFYDNDRNGASDEAIRIVGRGHGFSFSRHSFDADGDATEQSPRDYDVSISAFARGAVMAEDTQENLDPNAPLLVYDKRYTRTVTFRGIESEPILDYDCLPQLLNSTTWGRTCLVWDEEDHNVDWCGFDFTYVGSQPKYERWEGVIMHGNDYFHQHNALTSGPYNKRYEIDMKPQGPVRLYYHPVDRRIHLFHAENAWLEVDWNRDRKPDMRYALRDTDGDGRIDLWQLDLNRDDRVDDEWQAGNVEIMELSYTQTDLNRAITPVLRETPGQLYSLCQRLLQTIRDSEPSFSDPVMAYFEAGFQNEHTDSEVALKFSKSAETIRFYLDVAKDRMIWELKKRHANSSFWQAFDEARSQGNIEDMTALVEKEFGPGGDLETLSSWREGVEQQVLQKRVDWAQNWSDLKANIAWESDLIAYRQYYGQFDFFGKNKPALVLDRIMKSPPYHSEQEWGMDCLNVGETSGCGGLTLYVDGKAYLVRNPAGEGNIQIEKRLVSETDREVTIGVTFDGVGAPENDWKVELQCSAIAGKTFSPIRVRVDGVEADRRVEVGIGLTRLDQQQSLLDSQTGAFVVWGVQTGIEKADEIIGPIGMGIAFPPDRFARIVELPGETQVILSSDPDMPGVSKYAIQCEWLKGKRFDRCPAARDWLSVVRQTANEFRKSGWK